MERRKYQIKKDKYYKARGGFAHFLIIICACCQKEILLYQKDGDGRLLRMYADRIVAPPILVAKQRALCDKSDMEGLRCPYCDKLVATPMVYEKENRLAYRVINGSIIKQKSNGVFPSQKEI